MPWPQEDVWIIYDGHGYLLRGTNVGAKTSTPCISTPFDGDQVDAATERVYKFVSILGCFRFVTLSLGGFLERHLSIDLNIWLPSVRLTRCRGGDALDVRPLRFQDEIVDRLCQVPIGQFGRRGQRTA